MNKKIISLLLVAITLIGTLASCGSKDDDNTTADVEGSARLPVTLTLALPADYFTEEAREQVEAALSTLTTAKFDTAIELKLYTRDEYRDAYMEQLEDIHKKVEEEEKAEAERKKKIRELKKQGIKVEETETEPETEYTGDETVINELGISVKQYPDVGEKQYDIFLITNFEDYMYLIDNDYLQQLDSELTTTSKILKTYIYPTFLEMAKIGGTYAIPNNHAVGEYEFLLVNKELVEKYSYNPNKLNTILGCKTFIKDIAYQNLEGVTPLLGYVDAPGMVYWGENPNEWSVIASQIDASMDLTTKNDPKNIMNIKGYTEVYGMMKELEELGCIGDGVLDEGETFAVGVVTGDASVYDTYGDDYYVYIHNSPLFTEDDVFGHMFAVSSYSKSLARSMEIITYLNTSTDVRTVLQYGVEGIHWEYEDDDKTTIRILSDDYRMNLYDTGNAYMTYPAEGVSMDYWKYGKIQNTEAKFSPFFMFNHITDENIKELKALTAISKAYKDRLDEMTFEEFKSQVNALKLEIWNDEDVAYLLDTEVNTDSVVYVYQTWFNESPFK